MTVMAQRLSSNHKASVLLILVAIKVIRLKRLQTSQTHKLIELHNIGEHDCQNRITSTEQSLIAVARKRTTAGHKVDLSILQYIIVEWQVRYQ
jgi:hypothetical protein